MLLTITDGTVSLGGQPVLKNIFFEIRGTEKIAVVGRNGAGKTTLLRVLSGDLALDSNEKNPASGMETSRKLTVGVLAQQAIRDTSLRVIDYVLEGIAPEDRFSTERYRYECEFDRMYTGLGLRKEDKRKTLGEFSGGEQTKIALIRLLMTEPDVLLLDEPTNHLDSGAVDWLEEELRQYPKAVVMVSHDRYFLDRTAEVIWELEQGALTRYPGNYTAYRREKAARYERQRKAWERQQAEIGRLEHLIERFRHKPNKAAFARSRKKILERMERIEKPVPDTARIHTEPIEPASRCAKWVFSGEDLVIGYDKPMHRLTFRIPRGGKWAVLGENGSGKTTLLRTLAGGQKPLSGRLSVGNGVEIGYFDQHAAELQSERSVMEWFAEAYPAMTEKEIRERLGAYLFFGRDLGKRVSSLSGGEKARLVLAKILTARPNVLILDEPTNHMDIPARETIESILMCYRGTVILVSHDRYLIRKTAGSLLFLEKGRSDAWFYPFDYEHYRNHLNTAGRARAEQRTLEEQAMIESLHAVPRAERHRLREIPTERAWEEWRLERLEEEMAEARDLCGEYFSRRAEQSLAEAIRDWGGEEPLEEGSCSGNPASEGELQDEEFAREEETALQEVWTKACISWYEAWEMAKSVR